MVEIILTEVEQELPPVSALLHRKLVRGKIVHLLLGGLLFLITGLVLLA
jgi:hypothetical protein